jgi:hypothetical protein
MNKSHKTWVACFSLLCAIALLIFSLADTSEAAAKRVVRGRASRAAKVSKTPPLFAGGAGTQKSPYVIRGGAQLAAFSNSVNSGNTYAGKHIRLDADVDLAGSAWVPIGISGKNGNRPFMGVFDGAGHTIWNLRTGSGPRPSAGLFGSIEKAMVARVNLQYVEIAGNSNVGGIAAFMKNSIVSDCTVSGSVVGISSVGGIAGSALGGVLQNCSFSGNVKGKNGIGGVVGTMDGTGIRAAAAAGWVDGEQDVGGIVGSILAGDLLECRTNVVTVNGRQNIGGIVGHIIDNGDLSKTVFDGQAGGDENVGGIVGRLVTGELANCVTWGAIRGKVHVGGIVGELAGGGVIDSVSNASVLGSSGVGGVVGYLTGGTVKQSDNRGSVKGGEAVGGVVGQLSRGNLAASKNMGSVEGYYRTGQVVGMEGEILAPFPPQPIPSQPQPIVQ